MKQFMRKNRILLAVVVFLMVVPVAAYYIGVFLLQRIEQKSYNYQKMLVDGELEKARVEKIPQMEEVDKEFERDGYVVNSILGRDREVDFIEYLEVLAGETENAINIEIVEAGRTELVKKTKSKKQIEEDKKSIEEQLAHKEYTSMQLELRGTYASLLNFVNKLENGEYYVNIISFSLEKKLVDDEAFSQKKSASERDIFSPVTNPDLASANLESKAILSSSLKVIIYLK